MTWLIPSIIATLVGTAVLASCYIYLYLEDKQKYLKIWALSWVIYFTRYVFMLTYLLWQQTPFLLITNQLSSLISGVLLLYGTHLFIERRLPSLILYAAVANGAWIVISVVKNMSFMVMALPTFFFLAFIYIWTGYIFLRHAKFQSKEAVIVGGGFIVWGIHKANYPFLRPIVWLAPWGYLLAAMLEFITALGLLLVYFRKTRDDLLDSQKRMVDAQRIANVGDWSWDLDKNNLVWSAETYRIFGQDPGHFMATADAFEKAIHPDDYERFIRERDAALEENRGIDIEHRITLPDNRHRWVHELSSVTVDEDGKVIKAAGTVQDITERKIAEEALQESRKRFSLAMEASQDGLFDWNLQTNQIYYSPGWKGILGFSDDELPNDFSVWERLTAPEDVERSWKMQQELIIRQRERFEIELKMRHKEGHWVDILSRATALFDNTGRAIRIIGTHVDITQRKKVERELKASENKFAKAFDNAPLLMSISSLEDGKFLDINNTFIHVTGFTREIALGRTSVEIGFISKQDKDRILNHLALNGRVFELELELKKADGSTLICLYSGEKITIEGEDRLLSIAIDITERKAMEKTIQESQRMESIGNLAGGIAHDFNNILFPIVGISEMLLEDLPAGSPEHQNVREIFKAGQRGSDLVRQILAFSRQSQQKMLPTRIQLILAEAVKLSRSTIPAYIEIHENIHPGCGPVMADATQVHQVIMNIITNAYHATESTGGKIVIELGEKEVNGSAHTEVGPRPGKYALMSIADSGHGMPADLLNKIFEPYFTTKEQGKGTGLGLAVVYGIIQAHKGYIDVSSEIGRGTTFNIYLPLMAKSMEKERAEEPEKESDPAGNETILMVDDDKQIAEMAKTMLERLGYTVTMRTSSTEALETFRKDPYTFDAVITDMNMPSMTGDRLADELMALRPDLPVILCTGFSERISKDVSAAAGIKAFLLKPIRKSVLARTLRKVLDEVQ